MRKKVFGKQLSRGRKSREALFRSLLTNVLLKGEMTTTLAKAKAIQPSLERLISGLKDNSLSAKRKNLGLFQNKRGVLEKLEALRGLSASRNGGYTRLERLPKRKGDNADMAKITFVSGPESKDRDQLQAESK